MIELDRVVVFEVVRSGLNDQGGNCTASRRQGNRGILRGRPAAEVICEPRYR